MIIIRLFVLEIQLTLLLPMTRKDLRINWLNLSHVINFTKIMDILQVLTLLAIKGFLPLKSSIVLYYDPSSQSSIWVGAC